MSILIISVLIFVVLIIFIIILSYNSVNIKVEYFNKNKERFHEYDIHYKEDKYYPRYRGRYIKDNVREDCDYSIGTYSRKNRTERGAISDFVTHYKYYVNKKSREEKEHKERIRLVESEKYYKP